LDVPMQLAGGVERQDAFDELPQCVAQTPVVRFALRIPHILQKVRSTHELHRKENVPGLTGNELVEVDEVRVLNVGERAKFLFEPVDRPGLACRKVFNAMERCASRSKTS